MNKIRFDTVELAILVQLAAMVDPESVEGDDVELARSVIAKARHAAAHKLPVSVHQ